VGLGVGLVGFNVSPLLVGDAVVGIAEGFSVIKAEELWVTQ
jgi:hypothetical protein